MRVGRNNLFHIGGLNLASQADNFEHIFADAEDQHPRSAAALRISSKSDILGLAIGWVLLVLSCLQTPGPSRWPLVKIGR